MEVNTRKLSERTIESKIYTYKYCAVRLTTSTYFVTCKPKVIRHMQKCGRQAEISKHRRHSQQKGFEETNV